MPLISALPTLQNVCTEHLNRNTISFIYQLFNFQVFLSLPPIKGVASPPLLIKQQEHLLTL